MAERTGQQPVSHGIDSPEKHARKKRYRGRGELHATIAATPRAAATAAAGGESATRRGVVVVVRRRRRRRRRRRLEIEKVSEGAMKLGCGQKLDKRAPYTHLHSPTKHRQPVAGHRLTDCWRWPYTDHIRNRLWKLPMRNSMMYGIAFGGVQSDSAENFGRNFEGCIFKLNRTLKISVFRDLFKPKSTLVRLNWMLFNRVPYIAHFKGFYRLEEQYCNGDNRFSPALMLRLLALKGDRKDSWSYSQKSYFKSPQLLMDNNFWTRTYTTQTTINTFRAETDTFQAKLDSSPTKLESKEFVVFTNQGR